MYRIKVTIIEIDFIKGEFITKNSEGDTIRIDPCVGCDIPYSFFELLDLERLVGKQFLFEGNYCKEDAKLYLSSSMYDID